MSDVGHLEKISDLVVVATNAVSALLGTMQAWDRDGYSPATAAAFVTRNAEFLALLARIDEEIASLSPELRALLEADANLGPTIETLRTVRERAAPLAAAVGSA